MTSDNPPEPQEENLLFADALSTLEEADFYILGASFDATCSHRKGCASGPAAVRRESWNFETYHPDHGVDLEDVNIFDAGDVTSEDQEKLLELIEEHTAEALKTGMFPILLGGEHSVTVGAVRAFKKKHPDLFYVHVDAHLDFREQYEDNPLSHACVHRRVVDDILGKGGSAAVGIRSYCRDEARVIEDYGLVIFNNDDVQYEDYIEELLKLIGDRPVYLSLDIDAVDPAYAPGVGTPEPFGMEPSQVRELITQLSDRMVGFDCVEVNPEYDNGNTAALAARLIREVIVLKSLE